VAGVSRWIVRDTATPGEAGLEVELDHDGSTTRLVGLIGRLVPASRAEPAVVEVVVGGWRYELEAEDSRRAALRQRATLDPPTGTSADHSELHAIIPGRIVEVMVGPGDPVESGQPVLVVEAMKMQNEVRSPRNGVIERVAVGSGQTIELGDLLVVIGDPERAG
jgi:biotin carboxyl carrier protein